MFKWTEGTKRRTLIALAADFAGILACQLNDNEAMRQAIVVRTDAPAMKEFAR